MLRRKEGFGSTFEAMKLMEMERSMGQEASLWETSWRMKIDFFFWGFTWNEFFFSLLDLSSCIPVQEDGRSQAIWWRKSVDVIPPRIQMRKKNTVPSNAYHRLRFPIFIVHLSVYMYFRLYVCVCISLGNSFFLLLLGTYQTYTTRCNFHFRRWLRFSGVLLLNFSECRNGYSYTSSTTDRELQCPLKHSSKSYGCPSPGLLLFSVLVPISKIAIFQNK